MCDFDQKHNTQKFISDSFRWSETSSTSTVY